MTSKKYGRKLGGMKEEFPNKANYNVLYHRLD